MKTNKVTRVLSTATVSARDSIVSDSADTRGCSQASNDSGVLQPYCSRKAVITIAIRLRYDYDPTTTYRARLLPFDEIRREQKVNMSIFRRSRVVVESQL